VRADATGAPILANAAASIECKVAEIVEVVEANVAVQPTGRADEAILEMKELGEKIFYGG
jgi:flavin reductase (DIM6/NTAB) family NADH-FMN oxidoreductase RutF